MMYFEALFTLSSGYKPPQIINPSVSVLLKLLTKMHKSMGCKRCFIVIVMPTLPLLAGDLRFFASSPALPLWYINLLLLTSTINIEYLVKK